MSVNDYAQTLPDFAKDTRLNLGSVLTVEGAPGLTTVQIWGTALAVAYTLRSKRLLDMVIANAADSLSDAHREAAKGASSIMAMNNVYYRGGHLLEDAEFSKLPARLRMNVIGKPGIDKVDFELYSFAVSSINGCGKCLQAHHHELRKANLSLEGIQSSLRIASVLAAAAQSEWMAEHELNRGD